MSRILSEREVHNWLRDSRRGERLENLEAVLPGEDLWWVVEQERLGERWPLGPEANLVRLAGCQGIFPYSVNPVFNKDRAYDGLHVVTMDQYQIYSVQEGQEPRPLAEPAEVNSDFIVMQGTVYRISK